VEARTGLVIGGMTAVAASVAVVTFVALANTLSLAESPGTTVASEQVIVPSSAFSPSATPRATPAATIPATLPSTEPEVVEAPAPVVVDAPPPTNGPHTSDAPEVAEVAEPAAPSDLASVIAAAKATGSWDAVREWALAHGWQGGRLEALLARLDRELADQTQQLKNPAYEGGDNGDSADRQGLVGSDLRNKYQDRQQSQDSSGAKRPAHAGSNVGNGNGAEHDEKKDRPRNSPDKRG
jgi:hypothetical protein